MNCDEGFNVTRRFILPSLAYSIATLSIILLCKGLYRKLRK